MRKHIETLAGALLAILIAVGTGSCSLNQSSAPTDTRPIVSAWGTPFINAAAPQYLNYSKTVTDSNANSTLFWVTAGDNQLTHVWAQRYDSNRHAWGDAIQLDDNDLGTLGHLSLDAAVDSAGNVVVLWIAYDFGSAITTKIRVSRYVAAREHWDTATTVRDLQTNYYDLIDKQLIVDDAGNAAVVWREAQAAGNQLWVAALSASGTWTTQHIASTETPYSEPYEIRFDRTGSATLTWIQATNDVDNLWATQRASNGMWETPKILNVQNTGSVYEFKSAIDLLGNVTWVWRQYTGVGTNARLWSARITAGSKLGETAVAVTPVDLDLSTHAIWGKWDLVGSGTEKFALIWSEAEAGSNSKIWSRTLASNGNWSAPAAIETIVDSYYLRDLRSVVDSVGRVTVVWRLTSLSGNSTGDPLETFHANRMNNEGVWGITAKISNVVNEPLQGGIVLDLRLDRHDNLYITHMLWGSNIGRGEQFRIARIGAQHLFDGTPLVAATLGDHVQYSPQIAFGASGTAIVSWIKYDDNFSHLNGGLSVCSVSADGNWSSVTNLEYADSIGSLPPLVVQDKNGAATLVWNSVLTTGEVRMRTARFSNGEWTAGLDAAPPTDETSLRNRPESLWLDSDDIPMLTARTDETQKGRSTLWSVGYPVSE